MNGKLYGEWDTSSSSSSQILIRDERALRKRVNEVYNKVVYSNDPRKVFENPMNVFSNWDVRYVTDFTELFAHKNELFDDDNIKEFVDISRWDMSSARNLTRMFAFCSGFNQPIGNWKLRLVENASGMFDGCISFNQPLGQWEMGNLINAQRMFASCAAFNQQLNTWYSYSLVNTQEMFRQCESFNQSLSRWDMSNLQVATGMFRGCTSFNGSLYGWNVRRLEDAGEMFQDCESFNQPLNSWQLLRLTRAVKMFYGCRAFNQRLDNWNVSNLQNAWTMFAHCVSFNQPLTNWDVSSVTAFHFMFSNCQQLQQDFSPWYERSAAYRTIIDNGDYETIFFFCPLMTYNLISPHAPPPPPPQPARRRQVQMPQGVAYEVHRYAERVIPKVAPLLQQLPPIRDAMNDQTLRPEDVFVAIGDALRGYFQRVSTEPNAPDEEIQGVILRYFQVGGRDSSIDCTFFEQNFGLMKGVVDFVLTLPEQYQTLYFGEYVQQTFLAYNTGTASKSCVRGAYERIVTVVSVPISILANSEDTTVADEATLKLYKEIQRVFGEGMGGINPTTLNNFAQTCIREMYEGENLPLTADEGTEDAVRIAEFRARVPYAERTRLLKRCVKGKYAANGYLESADAPQADVEKYFDDLNEVDELYGGKSGKRHTLRRRRTTSGKNSGATSRRRHRAHQRQTRRGRSCVNNGHPSLRNTRCLRRRCHGNRNRLHLLRRRR